MHEITLNMYHAVALGAAMFWIGNFLTAKIALFNRFCIPAPLVGGLCFALTNTIFYASGIAMITFDNTLETVFMTMFFTTVGFTVSLPALVKGGKSVILLLLLGIVMIVLQNGLGGGLMSLLGENPLYGIGCGSIALIKLRLALCLNRALRVLEFEVREVLQNDLRCEVVGLGARNLAARFHKLKICLLDHFREEGNKERLEVAPCPVRPHRLNHAALQIGIRHPIKIVE